MEFSEKIKTIRKKNDLSQSDFGQQLGVTNRAVSKWEKGVAMPSTETLLEISKIFGVPLDYFLREELTVANAAVTAEAAVQVAMERLE